MRRGVRAVPSDALSFAVRKSMFFLKGRRERASGRLARPEDLSTINVRKDDV